jgi:hypothetical protein
MTKRLRGSTFADDDEATNRQAWLRVDARSHYPVRRISLEIGLDGPPISGHITAESDAARPFAGWMSLLAELEHAIGANGGDPATETQPERVPDAPKMS